MVTDHGHFSWVCKNFVGILYNGGVTYFLQGRTFMPLPTDSRSAHDLLTEKFHALLAECDLVIDTAEHGRTFHDLDDFFCTKGHDFLQEVYQQKLQEKKSPSSKKPTKESNAPTVKKNGQAKPENENASRHARTSHPPSPVSPLFRLQTLLFSRRRNSRH